MQATGPEKVQLLFHDESTLVDQRKICLELGLEMYRSNDMLTSSPGTDGRRLMVDDG